MKKQDTKRLILSALFLSLGVALPFLTANIKEIGDSLLPMHLTVMLCGALCGPYYGLAVGFATPFLKSLISAMPPLYPNAVWMAAELMTYGFVLGFVYSLFKKKGVAALYISLISAMISGRIVWGTVKSLLLFMGEKPFTIAMFFAEGFADAALGITLQLLLIPTVVALAEKIKRT